MSTPEERLAASLGRLADQVAVSPDAWSENRRRLAGHRSPRRPTWVVPTVAASVVAVLVSVSLLLTAGADRSPVAGPAVTLDDRHFGDPALEACVRQIRSGDGDIAQISGVDPAGTPIVFRLADDTLCTMFSAGGGLAGSEGRVSDDVPFLTVTGGTGWMVALGAVTSDVDRITFTPSTGALATITVVPSVTIGPLRAFAMRLPGAGTVSFLDGDTIVGRSDVAPIPFDPVDSGMLTTPGGADLLVPAAQRQSVGALSGPDVATGAILTLDDERGQVVVLPMWGSWCMPCRDQQAAVNTAAAAVTGIGVHVLGLDVHDDPALAAAFTREFAVPYPSMTATTEDLATALPGVPVSSIPATVLIDRQHRVAQVFVAVADADRIIAAATALAAE